MPDISLQRNLPLAHRMAKKLLLLRKLLQCDGLYEINTSEFHVVVAMEVAMDWA